jgi:hypothetical protein
MRIATSLVCLLLGSWLCTAKAATLTLELAEKVQVIGDKAPHNAFTDLIRFQKQWYCVYREGAGHASGAGTIRVLVSGDGRKWTSAALIESKDVDLRDPKLSRTPDGRLMIVGGAAAPASRRPVRDHYSFVTFSRDGKSWTAPKKVLGSWQWLWRVTWHKKTAYGVTYQWDPKKAEDQQKWTASLYKSKDGLDYDKVADFKIANATEASLAFDRDIMYCLQRRDGKPNTAMLGQSKPPYTDWKWKDLGVYYGGPQLIRLDKTWIAAGRLIEKGQPRTVLCRLNVAEAKLQPLLTLPSGGDTSYPGLVYNSAKDQLWVSYYSSHEGKTKVYLARVDIMP